MAEDSELRAGYESIVPLDLLIGSLEDTKKAAFELARLLLRDEPEIRAIRQLEVFEERVIEELRHNLHSIHLYQFVVRHQYSVCRFWCNCTWARDLSHLQQLLGGAFTVEIISGNGANSLMGSATRSARRIAAGRYGVQTLVEELKLLVRRLDPYGRRFQLFTLWNPMGVKGGHWFYSTAITFTQIGQRYEPFAPERFHYLVENLDTGGRPLRDAGRDCALLYAFAEASHRPTSENCRSAIAAITEHIRSVPLAADFGLARDLFLEGEWFRVFCGRLLGLGLFHSSVCRAFLDQVEPQSIWVGNPVWEKYLLVPAMKRSIPTTVLQHGLLGDFCQFSDPPVDTYVVRGQFWADFLSPEARRRAVVLNPPEQFRAVRAADRPDGHVLFLTGFRNQEFCHLDEVQQLVEVLLRVTVEARRKLIIRVHPLERVPFYRSLVARLAAERQLAVGAVEFSQGGPMDALVDGSCAVVTYYSTVFLDCLRQHVPVIGIGWHQFSYKRQIEPLGVYHFAQTFSECGDLVRRAMRGELKAYGADAKLFLAPTTEVELRAFFHEKCSAVKFRDDQMARSLRAPATGGFR